MKSLSDVSDVQEPPLWKRIIVSITVMTITSVAAIYVYMAIYSFFKEK